jgi:hypothetical protein
MGETSGSGNERSSDSWLGPDDPSAAHGAALGIGGIDGWWAWRHRRRTQRGIDAVSPATGRGALPVTLWFCGLAAITFVGPLLFGGPRFVWFAVGVVVMILAGWWWDARPGSAGRDDTDQLAA